MDKTSNATIPTVEGRDYERVIDALVAEFVCGWEWWAFLGRAYMVPDWNLHARRESQSWSSWKPWTTEEKEIDPTSLPSGSHGIYAPPRYSTNLNACFDVQAKVIEKVGVDGLTGYDRLLFEVCCDDFVKSKERLPHSEAHDYCQEIAREALAAIGEKENLEATRIPQDQ